MWDAGLGRIPDVDWREVRAEQRELCSQDFLYWVNTFVLTYDPRLVKATLELPFNTYAFQDEALVKIFNAVGNCDLLIEKSRDQGASWMFLLVFVWFWLYRPRSTFLLVSRTETLVDSTENPDSLFWKIMFILDHLPPWMCPRYTKTNLHLSNKDNGATIDGASTTGNVGRGGRRTAIMLDEFAAFEQEDGYKALAATQQVTRSRMFNSTPQGIGNAHYDMAQSEILKLRLHWSDHPVQSQGLYRSEKGKPQLLDKDYWARHHSGADYKFVCDGKLRSPYYDRECKRTPIASLIAQELDIDYLGAGSQFFDADRLNFVQTEYVRPPYRVGELDFSALDCEPVGWKNVRNGRMQLWIHPDARDDMPTDRSYVVGVDIAAGTGASNSCIAAVDCKTGEKVAEFVSPHIRPEDLAGQAVAICRWFAGHTGRGAYLIWEATGPGRQFGARVLELGYTNVYYRRNEISIGRKVTDVPGWWPTRDSKRAMLGELGRAMATGEYIERSKQTLQECREYVYLSSGDVGHSRAHSCMDPSGARDNHGDRVVASGLAVLAKKEVAKMPETKERVPYGSYQWRRDEYLRTRLEDGETNGLNECDTYVERMRLVG